MTMAMTDKASLTLAWATDIHLDHAEPDIALDFIERVRASGAAALLLGGDIATALDVEAWLQAMADHVGLPIHFVLGNHDYYEGSLEAVRARIGALRHPALHWLAQVGPVELAPDLVLVGNGGWGDARIGEFAGSDVLLNDYFLIEELRLAFRKDKFTDVFGQGTALEGELRRLGREQAAALAPQLESAAGMGRHVLVLTHVPPFREACWHEGGISDEDWLPAYTCGAVGETLLAAAVARPECSFTVLCGHTHSGGTARIADNLVVHTQAAEYGRPGFLLLKVDGSGRSTI
jgi:predicted phosphohydrolase